jgi:hypothetical protein
MEMLLEMMTRRQGRSGGLYMPKIKHEPEKKKGLA